MTLREFQRRENLSNQEMADLLELSIGHVTDLLTRTRGCSLEVAIRIEEKTNGKVKCRDLLARERA